MDRSLTWTSKADTLKSGRRTSPRFEQKMKLTHNFDTEAGVEPLKRPNLNFRNVMKVKFLLDVFGFL